MKPIIYSMTFMAVIISILFMLPNPKVPEISNGSIPNISIEAIDNNSFRLTNITVFDGQSWHENSELVVKNGYIVAGPSNHNTAAQQLSAVDGNKGFVIPGLIDAHTHTWGDALKEALVFGVTTELDMFTELSFAQQAKSTRDLNEKTSQADFYSAGTLITSTGGHGTEYGFTIPTIDQAELADQFVLDRINEGSDYIKIVYHHQDEYFGLTSLSKEVLIAVIKATHKYNKLAVVHVTDHQSAVEAVEAGANGLVHTFGDQLIEDSLLRAMKERMVFVIPTLSVIASMAQSDHSLKLAADKNLSKHLSASSRNGLNPFTNIVQRPETLTTAIENTRLMHDFGIMLLAGTDAPNPGTAHGISMHGELDLLNQAGLSPTEALQAAGISASLLFPIGNRGGLKDGAKADFIWLSEDPRIDIKNSRKIIGVWKNGYQIEEPITNSKSHGVTLPAAGLLSDFSADSLKSTLNTEFQPTSDQMMQGQSTASVNWTDAACDGGGLSVQGQIKAGFPYPWSGVFLPFSANMDKVLNLEPIQTIDFNISGDAGTYQLMVFTLNNMQPVQLPFQVTEQCQPVSFVLSEHPTVNWGMATGLAWVADSSRLKPELASFAFKLDNVLLKFK